MRTIAQLSADVYAGWRQANRAADAIAATLTDRERALILAAHQVGYERDDGDPDADEIIRDVCRTYATQHDEKATQP